MTHLKKKLKALASAFMQSRLIKAWEQAAMKRAEYYLARNTIKELQSLSDAELKDIGLARGDIYYAATQSSKNT